jgi:tight adherence protein B
VSIGVTYLLLLGTLAVFIVGLVQAERGWAQRSAALARGRIERGDPARRLLRARLEARLRRTRFGAAVESRVLSAGVDVGLVDFLLLTLLGALLAFGFGTVALGRTLGVLAGIAALFGAFRFLAFRRARRREAFVAQLPDVARVMSNASSAGLSLPRAVELTAVEMGEPSGEVLQRVVDELRVGQSVDRALENLHQRMPSREVSVLVSTLVIQQRAGGDTVRALRDMADTLQLRKDLRREVRTVMAGAITTGWVVAGLGAGSLLLLNLISPGVVEQMTGDPIGRVALLTAALLYAIGFTLIRRITRIET